MIRLLLLRHAKSDWSDAGLADRDRPLTKRGRAGAELIAGHMRQQALMPDRVLSSPATRTRQTISLVLDVTATSPKSCSTTRSMISAAASGCWRRSGTRGAMPGR